MSLYQLHRTIYDFIRSSEVKSGASVGFDLGRYELTDEEKRAFDERDVATLYQMGLHPVLLNAYCRALGFSRDDYRKLLEPFAEPPKKTPRWRAQQPVG